MALTRIRGSVWNTGDNLVVDVLGDIGQVDREGIVFVSGLVLPNDGMGGWFKYDPNVPRNQNDSFSTVDPTGTRQGKGCWIRQNILSNSTNTSGTSETQIARTGQQAFTLNTITYPVGQGALTIYLNGMRLTAAEFTETSPNTVSLIRPVKTGDTVEFIAFQNNANVPAIAAAGVSYSNTVSGLPGTNVQLAIDNLKALLDQSEVVINPVEPVGVPVGTLWVDTTLSLNPRFLINAGAGNWIAIPTSKWNIPKVSFGTAAPAQPNPGDMWLTPAGVLVLFDGASWETVKTPPVTVTQTHAVKIGLSALVGDGNTRSFPLIDVGGNPVNLHDAWQLSVWVDGIRQEPGKDYTLLGTNTLQMNIAPEHGAGFWAEAYLPTLGGGGAGPGTAPTIPLPTADGQFLKSTPTAPFTWVAANLIDCSRY